MYCGTGSIGLSMADKVSRLVGVEIVPQAVENAKINAEKLDVTENTVFFVDPPRKGCDTQTLDAVISMNVQKLSMISCNPSTAARDCKYLCEHGYKVDMIQPFDMFPRTKHVETVIKLTKQHI